MTKTTSKSSFSRFSQFFPVFPGKTEPSSLGFFPTLPGHTTCVSGCGKNYGSPLRKDQKHPSTTLDFPKPKEPKMSLTFREQIEETAWELGNGEGTVPTCVSGSTTIPTLRTSTRPRHWRCCTSSNRQLQASPSASRQTSPQPFPKTIRILGTRF